VRFRSGCCRRPRSSRRAVTIATVPNRKSLKWNRRRRRRRPHHRAASSRCTAQAARAGRASSAPPKPNFAAPDSSAPTRQEIKSAGRNAGESTRRSSLLSVLQIFRSVVDDPVADRCQAPPAQRHHHHHLVRPDRPSSIVAPTRFTKTKISTAQPSRSPSCGQQSLHRPGGSRRSVCVTARWNRRSSLARV